MNDLELNPYSPPAAVLHPVEEGDLVYPQASKGKRFVNYLLDRFAVMGVAMLLGAVLAIMEEMNLIHGFVDWISNISRVEDFLFTALLSVFYYLGMEWLFGRSLGKLITGTKVLADTGMKPSFGAVLGRSFARIVPFEAFSFLGERGWHDSWSGTQVVDVRKPKVPRLPDSVMRLYR